VNGVDSQVATWFSEAERREKEEKRMEAKKEVESI